MEIACELCGFGPATRDVAVYTTTRQQLTVSKLFLFSVVVDAQVQVIHLVGGRQAGMYTSCFQTELSGVMVCLSKVGSLSEVCVQLVCRDWKRELYIQIIRREPNLNLLFD